MFRTLYLIFLIGATHIQPSLCTEMSYSELEKFPSNLIKFPNMYKKTVARLPIHLDKVNNFMQDLDVETNVIIGGKNYRVLKFLFFDNCMANEGKLEIRYKTFGELIRLNINSLPKLYTDKESIVFSYYSGDFSKNIFTAVKAILEPRQ